MIVFIPCVKTKKQTKTKAQNLYQSDLFNKSLAYAKSLNPREIFILSAKYGVLKLDDTVKPYNRTLNNMGKKEQKLWAYKCYKQLKDKNVDFSEEAIFLTGKNYRKYLIQKFSNTRVPMKGLAFGEQLRFLKSGSTQKPAKQTKTIEE